MSTLSLVLFGFLLVLIQVLAALPWMLAINWAVVRRTLQDWLQNPQLSSNVARLLVAGVALVIAGVAPALFLGIIKDPDSLETWGRVYGCVLHLQLIPDTFVLFFLLLQLVWSKGGAVAFAAFREGLRQPMFWLILSVFGAFILLVLPLIPLFTFGEDFIMMKELDYDLIMFAGLLFGVLAASITVSEEIEGRTAITLMSKPVSRRQFLLGKFIGILCAALVLIAVLGWIFDWSLIFKKWFERAEALPRVELRAWIASLGFTGEAADYLRGVGIWFEDAWEAAPGLILAACRVMVLLAVAVSLATRVPLIVNLITCSVVYLLGHLTPLLVDAARRRLETGSGNETVSQMLLFMAQLFDHLLPRLDYFALNQARLAEAPLPAWEFHLYVGSVCLYGVLYTAIVLLFGLILFEDRDLA
jgi:hypothetical protein